MLDWTTLVPFSGILVFFLNISYACIQYRHPVQSVHYHSCDIQCILLFMFFHSRTQLVHSFYAVIDVFTSLLFLSYLTP